MVAGGVAEAVACNVTVPETLEPLAGLVTDTAGGDVAGIVCESTVTVFPLICKVVSVTSLDVLLSVSTCCGSTVACNT